MTDLTKSLEEMEGIADRATGGEWQECGHDREGCICRQVWAIEPDCVIALGLRAEDEDYTGGDGATTDQAKANARHIATFDPPRVKALLRIAKAANDDRDCLSRPIREALEALHTEGDNDE